MNFNLNAAEVMRLADRFCVNGMLTVSEMGTYLRGTKYHPFMLWLCNSKNFREFDTDHTGSLSIPQLESALTSHQLHIAEKYRNTKALSQSGLLEALQTFFTQQAFSRIESSITDRETLLLTALVEQLGISIEDVRRVQVPVVKLQELVQGAEALKGFGEWLEEDQKRRAADPKNEGQADKVWLLKAVQRYEHQSGPPQKAKHDVTGMDPVKAARCMFELADRFDCNGELTVGEMQTFLSHDLEWGHFIDWLTRDVHSKMFHAMDTDGSGTLNEMELAAAVAQWKASEPELARSVAQYQKHHQRHTKAHKHKKRKGKTADEEANGVQQFTDDDDEFIQWREEEAAQCAAQHRQERRQRGGKSKDSPDKRRRFLASRFPLTISDKQEVQCPNCCGISDLRRFELKDHLKICPNAQVMCPAEGCGLQIARGKLMDHIQQSCAYIEVGCPNAPCGFTGPRRTLKSHIEIKCEFVPVDCPNKCENSKLNRSNYMEHLASQCPNRAAVLDIKPSPEFYAPRRKTWAGTDADKWSDVKEAPDSRPATPQNFECKYCGELVPMSEKRVHRSMRAPKELMCVELKDKCKAPECQQIVYCHEWDYHKEHLCPGRIVQCGRCGISIKAAYLQQHMATVCPLLEVLCPHNCGIRGLVVSTLDHHLQNECLKRHIECTICGELVEAGKMPLHTNKHKRDQRLGWEQREQTEYLPFKRVRKLSRMKKKAVRCEQCGVSVPFVSYAMHVRHCAAGLRQPLVSSKLGVSMKKGVLRRAMHVPFRDGYYQSGYTYGKGSGKVCNKPSESIHVSRWNAPRCATL